MVDRLRYRLLRGLVVMIGRSPSGRFGRVRPGVVPSRRRTWPQRVADSRRTLPRTAGNTERRKGARRGRRGRKRRWRSSPCRAQSNRSIPRNKALAHHPSPSPSSAVIARPKQAPAWEFSPPTSASELKRPTRCDAATASLVTSWFVLRDGRYGRSDALSLTRMGQLEPFALAPDVLLQGTSRRPRDRAAQQRRPIRWPVGRREDDTLLSRPGKQAPTEAQP